MHTYHVFIVALMSSYLDRIVGECIKRGWEVAPYGGSKQAIVEKNDYCGVLIKLTIKNNIDKFSVFENSILDIFQNLDIKYFSCILQSNDDAKRYLHSNIKIPTSESGSPYRDKNEKV